MDASIERIVELYEQLTDNQKWEVFNLVEELLKEQN